MQYLSNEIKIHTTNLNDFLKVQKDLKDHNVEFFSYMPRDQRKTKIVMKAAPFYTPDELANIMAVNETPVEEIIKLKPSKKSNERTASSFLCIFPKTTSINDVKKLKAIDNTRLRWEPYAKKIRRTQCHRCQGFGHGSSYCNLPPRCVKCPGKHLTGDCSRKDRTDGNAECCNCGGPHAANYSGCPSYLDYIQQLNNKTVSTRDNMAKQNTHKLNSIPSNNNLIRENTNYSSAVKGKINPLNNPIAPQPLTNYNNRFTQSNLASSNDTSTFMELIEELKKLNQICNLEHLLIMVKELNSKLGNCPDNISKIIMLQNIVAKYDP